MKQYILIRTDKKYPIGKIMAHVGHNVFVSYLNWQNKEYNLRWNIWIDEEDQRKIVVEGGSENEIEKIVLQAKYEKIPQSFIEDVHIKERICAVIGPVSDEESYHLGLADLKLYREDR